MNPLSSLFGSVFTTLTGVDTTTLGTQIDAAEQTLIQAAEVLVFLLVVIALELVWVIRNTAK
jgi:hypothetical protein